MTSKKNMATEPQDGGFAALGLDPRILSALTVLGYEEPTPIQRETIPPLIAGKDLLGQAATGTGKTAAFALPILQRILNEGKSDGPTAVVLVPTRELAVQVSEAMHRYGKALGVRVLPVYGGQPIGRQLHALRAGIDIVVATPGRALDHIRRGSLQLGGVRVVGQTVLFSATMPPRIESIARKSQREPIRIQIARAVAKAGEMPQVRQQAYLVQRNVKKVALGRVLDLESPAAAIVFCRTRTEVDELTETMNARGYHSEALHGGMTQEQRDKVMKRLRSGDAELLIATDVAARGLDIEHLTHVINYDLPNAPEAYVHRIGRVGRAGREGVAITLVEPREHHLLRNIERITKQKIEVAKVPTVADLRTRRLELTGAAMREAILGEEKEHFRVVVDALSDEFDLVDIAMAAVRLYHQATVGDGEDEEIAEASAYPASAQGRDRKAGARPSRGARGGDNMAKLYIAAGRQAGIRPQDLVGAIANEAGVPGSSIGAIQITDRFSLVEVPEEAAEHVIKMLKQSNLRGKKVMIRREREA